MSAYKQFQQLNVVKAEMAKSGAGKAGALRRKYTTQLHVTAAALQLALKMVDSQRLQDMPAIDYDKYRAIKEKVEFSEKISDDEKKYFNAAGSIKRQHQVRYLLAYVYTQMQRYFEAGILGEFVAQHFDPRESMALDCAYFALSAYLRAYKQADANQNALEVQLLLRVTQLIDNKWPDSARANDARMTMARLYHRRQQPEMAAKWYDKIAKTSADFPQAQLAAGQSFWSLYLNSLQMPVERRPDAKQLQDWQGIAENRLRTGIDAVHQSLKKQKAQAEETQQDFELRSTDALTAGKVSLAQLLIYKRKPQEAITLLTEGFLPVVEAVTVKDETQRPKTGQKSRAFASQTYQLLLRAHVGAQQLEKAQNAMASLERIAGEADAGALTAIYVQIGRKLQTELSLSRDDPERIQQLQRTFEGFLGTLSKREAGLTLGTSLWIAETYAAFADGAADESVAAGYYERASAAYQQIVDRDAELSAAQRVNIQMRLVRSRRKARQFDVALDLVGQVLKSQPKALDVQNQAARILEDQAAADRSPDRYRAAMLGVKLPKSAVDVWGWSRMASILQRSLENRRDNPVFKTQLLESRLRLAACRYELAQLLDDKQQGQVELQKAKLEIGALWTVFGESLTPEWSAKFDVMYRKVLKALGEPEKGLMEIDGA
ncbi:MAG: hypothetical protein ABGZ17_19360 [Planctomycetaceae bacterium]